ncbi:hypothetical protein, partial [Methanobrevibacter sp.]|uniref:hypothetical protein n=1 Tax=Methanobrevibacter sp. TaxID=66852 RepID=UPI00388EDB7F
VKSTINTHLRSFRIFFPNLHDSISKLFQADLSRLSELSLKEYVNLYNRLKTYAYNYFNVFKNSESFKKEMEFRNDFENGMYDMQIILLNDSTFNFFDSSPVDFLRNLDNSDAETIKSVIFSEMAYIGIKNQGLYQYITDKFFNGKGPAQYFYSIQDKIPKGMEDKFFQDFYKNIQNEFNAMRNLLKVFSSLKTDEDRINCYLAGFEKAYNVSLRSDAANFTRTLLIALMNLHVHDQYKLENELVRGLNKDGSLKKEVKEKIVSKICQEFFKYYDGDFVLDEPDFTMFVEILTLNFQQNFNVKIMADYLDLISLEGGTSKFGTKNLARYNLILSLILKNKIMFGSKNVVLYPEELDLLNNLTALRCYNLMNEILQLKLNAEFSNKNTVAEGLIPKLNSILNSVEYKILNHKKVNAGDKHITPYYAIFNNANNLPNSLQGLINRIENELTQLGQFDSNLLENIRVKYLMGRTIPDLIDEYPEMFTQGRLKGFYSQIMKMLNSWRNQDILNDVAKV